MTDEITSEAELPLETAGTRLRRAREAEGLTLQQVAQSTKIPERHLAALEAGSYGSLPAKTYATGFARSYARMLGLDETPIIAAVREELTLAEPEPPRRTVQTFEPGDPSRLPSAGLVWVAVIGVVAALAAAIFFMRGNGDGTDALPSLLPSETPSAPAQGAAQSPAPVPSGAVVFTALAPDIWVKFYDGNGTQLLQKQLAQGETYTVPESPSGVQLWTARPDALAITIGGAPVPKLSDVQRTVKDVPVTAAALLARGTQPASTASPAGAAPALAVPRSNPRGNGAAPVRKSNGPAPARPTAPASPPTEAVPQLSPAPAEPAPAAT